MKELLIGAAGGLIAGIVVLLVENLIRRHEKKKETEEKRFVRFSNEERRITGSIFNYLGPGSSIELMKTELGPPNKKYKQVVAGLFDDEEEDSGPPYEEINSYLYFFKNASVKTVSKDGETINALTVIATDDDIDISECLFSSGTSKDFLNVTTLTSEMLADTQVGSFPGCRDYFFAAQKAVGPPYYSWVTYFAYPPSFAKTEHDIENSESAVGYVLDGICISTEPRLASYIYTSDLL